MVKQRVYTPIKHNSLGQKNMNGDKLKKYKK